MFSWSTFLNCSFIKQNRNGVRLLRDFEIQRHESECPYGSFLSFFFWFSWILWRVDDFVELWVFVNRIRIGGNFCIWNWSFWQCKHIFLWKMPKWPFFLFFVVMFLMCLDLVSFLSWQWLWDLKHICSFLSVHKEILLFSLIYLSLCVAKFLWHLWQLNQHPRRYNIYNIYKYIYIYIFIYYLLDMI